MGKKRFLVHLLAWPVLFLLVLAADKARVEAIAAAEPAGEVRSVPVYVQSRPVYSKPTPKPKLVLPKQPQISSISSSSNSNNNNNKNNNNDAKFNPNLVTQTVYGFADFVTTIGNTVMVFTPNTKKVDIVKPSIVTATSTSEVNVVVAPTATADISSEKSTSVSSSASPSPAAARQPKQLDSIEDSIPIIESSEYEPQIFATSADPAPRTSSLNLEYVNLASDGFFDQHDLSGEGSSVTSVYEVFNEPLPSVITPEVQIRSQVNVVSQVQSESFIEQIASPVFPSPSSSSASKGFTLKFSKPSQPITASKISQPKLVKPKPKEPEQPTENPNEPTGLINQIFETKVNDGVTTVHETKIIGTHIGTQYARVLESSSTVFPVITATKLPTPPAKLAKLTKQAQPLHIVEKASTTVVSKPVTPKSIEQVESIERSPEVHTAKSVVSSSDEFESQDESENFPDEESSQYDDIYAEPSSSIIIEPTPTASEEQTLYVLPQKEPKAELYVSPVPNNNAYSRQPQFYVDVSPAKSFDFIVTATPTRKQFRQSSGKTNNRFSQRFTNRGSASASSSTESNELAASQAAAAAASSESSPSEETTGRRRFRPRNRSSGGNGRSSETEVLPTVSVYNKVVSATPSRRFSTARTRTGKFSKEEKNYQEPTSFKTAQRGFGAATRQVQQIQPTSSSSIYRFKLNRPTGRWRFKPSPKPKVNIIKTKEEERDELTTQASSNSQALSQKDGAYLQNFSDTPEIQNLEESRTESNELVQDSEPELLPQTIRVATITPSEFSDLDKFLEIATIRSPYVFQAGNVKNTRFITLTKTFTKENIVPTQASAVEATLENILATRPPYERILEGSSDVATLPVIILGGDQATPPLETVTQTFSTTQLMLKTSILPVLYDGVTTLYTLTQSYFITRLVTAHKTIPPVELFQFVPTKALNEFNTALQEAGSENREHLVPSESETDENDTNYEHILAPPDELTSVGSDFDPSSMDEKFPKPSPVGKAKSLPKPRSNETPATAPQLPPELAGLTPEQLSFLRYFNQGTPTGQGNFFPPPLVPSQPQFELTSSPVVVDTTTTIVESKTLRLLFGAKPTSTIIYSTKVVPTRVTTYVTASVPVKSTAAIPNFFQPAPFPLAYVG